MAAAEVERERREAEGDQRAVAEAEDVGLRLAAAGGGEVGGAALGGEQQRLDG